MGILGASIAAALRLPLPPLRRVQPRRPVHRAPKGSSSSGSSSSSRGSSSSGGSYTPKGTHYDATITIPQQADQIQKYKDDYAAAAAKGDKAGMDAAHKAAESLRSGWGYSGGEDGSDYISAGGISGANLGEQI